MTATSGQSLKHTAFRGALAMGGSAMMGKVIAMGSGIVLARLLEPAEFGLVALCYVVLNIVGLLAPLGLGFSLIRHKGDVETAARQVFVVTLASAFGFFLAVLLGRHLLAGLLGSPLVADILPWMALMVPLRALTRVPEALIERNLGFTAMSRIAILHDAAHAAVAITLALLGYGVWSLVGGHLASALVVLVLNWWWTPSRAWLARRPWNGALMRSMIRYGLTTVASAAVYRFYMNVDNFIVGRVLGTAALGYYSRAFSFTTSTVDSIHKTLSSVLFPSYARIQDDRDRVAQAYLRSLSVISTITIPLALGLFVATPILVPALYGMKWSPAIPIMQVLAFVSVVKPVSASVGSLFNALGYPHYNMRAGIAVAVAMLAGIAGLIGFGTTGVAWAVVAANVVGYGYNILQTRTVLPQAASRMLPTALPAAAGALLMAGAMVGMRMLLPPVVTGPVAFLVLGAMTAAGAAVYGGFLYLFQRPLLRELWGLFRNRKR
jgi:PST family polysaccharide transporter